MVAFLYIYNFIYVGCSVEKRRWELECRYIEELAELVSSNMGDIASLSSKPDKCHILRSTVDQIQQIKRREQGEIRHTGHTCSHDHSFFFFLKGFFFPPDRESGPSVPRWGCAEERRLLQQSGAGGEGGAGAYAARGEWYSQIILSFITHSISSFFHLPLIQALDGFFFVVNREGRIVFVSENVLGYLGYTQEELINSSVYTILHVGDHNEFVRNLLPKSLGEWSPQTFWRFDCIFFLIQND